MVDGAVQMLFMQGWALVNDHSTYLSGKVYCLRRFLDRITHEHPGVTEQLIIYEVYDQQLRSYGFFVVMVETPEEYIDPAEKIEKLKDLLGMRNPRLKRYGHQIG